MWPRCSVEPTYNKSYTHLPESKSYYTYWAVTRAFLNLISLLKTRQEKSLVWPLPPRNPFTMDGFKALSCDWEWKALNSQRLQRRKFRREAKLCCGERRRAAGSEPSGLAIARWLEKQETADNTFESPRPSFPHFKPTLLSLLSQGAGGEAEVNLAPWALVERPRRAPRLPWTRSPSG